MTTYKKIYGKQLFKKFTFYCFIKNILPEPTQPTIFSQQSDLQCYENGIEKSTHLVSFLNSVKRKLFSKDVLPSLIYKYG